MSKIKKIYTSKSEISIKVLLDNGKTVRIAFTPRTMGSSVFITDDEELQKAIEAHKEYGKLFVCKNAGQVIPATVSQPTRQQSSDEGQQSSDEGQQSSDGDEQDGIPSDGGEPTTKVVPVGSIQEAKDYLADKFDIARSSIKSRAAIEASALSFGVVFEWLSKENQ